MVGVKKNYFNGFEYISITENVNRISASVYGFICSYVLEELMFGHHQQIDQETQTELNFKNLSLSKNQ